MQVLLDSQYKLKHKTKALQGYCYYIFNTYSMKIYVLLHFEHKNDVTIIVKLYACIELRAACE